MKHDLTVVPSHAQHIEEKGALEAYRYLVGYGITSKRFSCSAKNKGEVRDFRYHENGNQPFSFIINKGHLLFYFRKPAITKLGFNERKISEELGNLFEPHWKSENRMECTVKITNLSEAKKIADFALAAQNS